MKFLLLVLGFILLIKGADLFVDGASSIAKVFKIPSIIIGLTIVALGTSAPELAVNISALLKGSSNIAIGNIVGSNIVNILLILGVTAIIKPVGINNNILKRDFPFLILSTTVLLILCLDIYIGKPLNQLSKTDGIILLILFSGFLYYLIKSSIKSKKELTNIKVDEENSQENSKYSLPKSIVLAILGLIGIILGGNLVVEQSIVITRSFGISERVIGLTIVAVGTSLPELVTSIVAARKNESDIAIGNVIGSNLFNTLFILGLSSFIKPLSVEATSYFDIIFLTLATVITYIFALSKKRVSRYEGLLLSAFYFVYIGYLLV